MSNILNHNRDLFDLLLYKGDYWDFHLHEGMSEGDNHADGLTTDCLSVFIDTDDVECVWMDELYSKNDFSWDNAKSDGTILHNIGLTGVDNGLIKYEKDRITNKEFLKLYTHSELEILPGDTRLKLSPVNGNNHIYIYPVCLTNDEGHTVMKLDGGWFQGFFETPDGEYGVLPHTIGTGWVLETVLKPISNRERQQGTIVNDTHPENDGIFLYIGTRAENKWYKLYNTDATAIKKEQYYEDGYLKTDNASANDMTEYCETSNYGMFDSEGYIDYSSLDSKTIEKVKKIVPLQGYVTEGYVEDTDTKSIHEYNTFEKGYIEEDIKLGEDTTVETTDGFELGQPNIKVIETDNKFVMFDRTDEGLTTKSYQEGDKVKLHYIKQPKGLNYFTLFSRAKGDYTAKTINKLLSELNKGYDINADLYRNAIGFQITNEGAIGFKYLVKDCDENNSYKIENLFTKNGVVSADTWHTVSIKIIPTRPVSNFFKPKCQPANMSTDKMKIEIFVDGRLKLSSKELPILNLRKLNDLDGRQESVPYNISVGGGTQGLCDVVYMDYMKTPTDILPLEKEFAGSFIGLLKSFRFYTCPISFSQILTNSRFDKTNRF